MALLAVLWACKEEDLSDENPNPPEENIEVDLIVTYGDSTIARDSAYQNDLGETFYIDSVRILMSNLIFEPQGSDDTLMPDLNFRILRNTDFRKRVAKLPAGGYNGRFTLSIGLDSSAFFQFFDPENPDFGRLATPEIAPMVNMGFGMVNNVEIFGRVEYFESVLDTVPSIMPMHLRTAGMLLTNKINTQTLSFSISNTKTMRMVLFCNLKPFFQGYSVESRPVISADPSDGQDMAAAVRLRDSLKFGFF